MLMIAREKAMRIKLFIAMKFALRSTFAGYVFFSSTDSNSISETLTAKCIFSTTILSQDVLLEKHTGMGF